MKIFIYCLGFAAFLLPFAAGAQERPSPVLVELFTAENCPACPPADQYLGQLADSEHVMALACHVDYFGRGSIGLGQKVCTRRQEMYRQQLGKKKYYTPQMMVNGTREEIGYKSDKIAAEISKARGERAKHIAIAQKANGVFEFMVPTARPKEDSVTLWLATYAKPHQSIERGVRKSYYNVVQGFMPLGSWRGEPVQRAVYPLMNAQTAGFVIAAQDNMTGQILALGEYKIR